MKKKPCDFRQNYGTTCIPKDMALQFTREKTWYNIKN